MASNVSPDVERAAMESQPLLGAPVAGFPAIPVAPTKVAPRQWRHKWYHIFGDCGAQDVAATCLAWKVPCVAWAWNQNRASQRSFWLELCRFLVMTIGLFVMFQAACCVIMMTLCPEAMRDFDDAGVDAPHMAAPHHMGGPHGMHDGPRDMDDGPHGIPQECLARIAPAHLALAALAVALLISLSLFFARRRTAMREQFGIEGSVKEDALLYMCCGPCALAQETRTLMHEQVHEGVWYGALPGVQAPVQAAPAGQKMVV